MNGYVEIATEHLVDDALDWAVAQIELPAHDEETNILLVTIGDDNGWHYTPSSRWSQGGPIIEREGIVVYPVGGSWNASRSTRELYCYHVDDAFEGEMTNAELPLIAAMRCHVYNHFGATVKVPEELA